MDNDKEVCFGLINDAFVKAYFSPKIVNTMYNSNKDITIYYSYIDNPLLRKKVAQCFENHPKMVEKNRQLLEQSLDASYPGIRINVGFNGIGRFLGGDTAWPLITASVPNQKLKASYQSIS